ncbi:hypothetical protein [Nocardia brasiliensis]|uniref:Uncharacterized protein n=1 Tax=Nocardia brasiliensis (strain ATCC 700358 / HUJEG-1) TaxID=1133849 RepID=K0EM53_NOCB7|nr:hypothetical protein [Nocardia brasiliensis]AFT98511.1 hypothetical protein O3I_002745 [Nocardia brasiliensis ATCC 700358]OCF88815.1 hypothetical protein AW168_17655 [Nocardia brasiliensis]
MPEKFNGKTFRTPEESTYEIPPEELERQRRGWEEFDRARDAVPPEEQIHLRDRFGDEDKIGTADEAAYWADVEERKKRGEYWG